MRREFSTPTGTNLVAVSLPSGHIAGVEVDNPSGAWVRITGIEQWVPPWTNGWSAPVVPAASSIDARFETPPSGAPSTIVGGPVLVRLDNAPLPLLPGSLAGEAIGQGQGVPQVQFEYATFAMTQNGLGQWFDLIGTGLVDGFYIVPRLLIVSAGVRPTVEGMPAQHHLRGMATFRVRSDIAHEEVFPPLTISPESPIATVSAPPGRRLALSETVEGTIELETGIGAMYMHTWFEYILQRGPG